MACTSSGVDGTTVLTQAPTEPHVWVHVSPTPPRCHTGTTVGVAEGDAPVLSVALRLPVPVLVGVCEEVGVVVPVWVGVADGVAPVERVDEGVADGRTQEQMPYQLLTLLLVQAIVAAP